MLSAGDEAFGEAVVSLYFYEASNRRWAPIVPFESSRIRKIIIMSRKKMQLLSEARGSSMADRWRLAVESSRVTRLLL